MSSHINFYSGHAPTLKRSGCVLSPIPMNSHINCDSAHAFLPSLKRSTVFSPPVGEEALRYGCTLGRRQYLKEMAGRGPGPRRRGGAVTAPRWRGRSAGVYPGAN
jgi:hypothetical protein